MFIEFTVKPSKVYPSRLHLKINLLFIHSTIHVIVSEQGRPNILFISLLLTSALNSFELHSA